MKNFKYRIIGKELNYFIFSILFVIIQVLMTLFIPLYVSYLIDHVINLIPITNPIINLIDDIVGGYGFIRENLHYGAFWMLFFNLILCISLYYKAVLSAKGSENMAFNLRNKLYDHIQKLPYSYHANVKTGDLVQRCTSDVETIRRFFATQINEIVYAVFIVMIALIVLFVLNTKLALVALIAMPIIFFFAIVFFKNMQRVFKKSDEIEGELSTIIQENLTGVRVVKAFNQEKEEIAKFENKNLIYTNLNKKMIKLLGIYWGLSDTVCLLQILLVIIFGIYFRNNNELSVGNFFVFLSYETMILWPLRQLGRVLSDAGKMDVSFKRLEEIIAVAKEDLDSGIIKDIKGEIKFKDVHFSYPDGNEEVLKGVNFEIKPNQTIAIMGATGSGKSTIAYLLTRLYDCNQGQILIDGIDIKEIQKKCLRDNIGIVLQEPFLFSKSIYDNLQLANNCASKEEIYLAAKTANIHDVIENFDRGYDTPIGEKGVTLSGGQKQRLAIARSIIKNCKIMIFDDSLSAVDSQTDALIRKKLKEYDNNITSIIITHRINSAKDADLILVLDKGKVVQSGTHTQLIQEDGLYQRVYNIQNYWGGRENESRI